MNQPKVLFYDIETAPMLGFVWKLWDNNIGLNQIHSDWYVLSWAAKWLDKKQVMYKDQKDEKDIENDINIIKDMWELLDEADIVVTYNGKKFDQKKLNTRFIVHGLKPPSTYKHIDLYQLCKKHFGFTSNKLEYVTQKLNKKNKKSTHKNFPGFMLWSECLKRNPRAWKEMKKYNKLDVVSLEELYNILMPWDNTVNFNLYDEDATTICKCGSTEFRKKGFAYTNVSKFQRYICTKCGSNSRGRKNLFSKEKMQSLKTKIKG